MTPGDTIYARGRAWILLSEEEDLLLVRPLDDPEDDPTGICPLVETVSTTPPVEPPSQDPESHIRDLRGILDRHLQGFWKPWAGGEWGKTLVGNAILKAMEDLGLDPKSELDASILRISTKPHA